MMVLTARIAVGDYGDSVRISTGRVHYEEWDYSKQEQEKEGARKGRRATKKHYQVAARVAKPESLLETLGEPVAEASI